MADKSELYKIRVNDFHFCLDARQVDEADIQKISPSVYNLVKDHRSVDVKVVNDDPYSKCISVEIEGEIFSVEITNELDQMIEKMGYGTGRTHKPKEIRAPMPGLVLEIAVSDGQEVNEGDNILILEAMKMENNIMIQSTARIKKIAVSAGQAVEKGQLLVELE